MLFFTCDFCGTNIFVDRLLEHLTGHIGRTRAEELMERFNDIHSNPLGSLFFRLETKRKSRIK
jgi:hypothetical protein